VKGIVTKVALGEADAGFVYRTDAKPVASRTRSVALPGWAQPAIRYEIAVVKASSRPDAAKAFVKKLFSKRGRLLLKQAGFGLPEQR
jgi:molybdate transport system substrate-binding protein